MAEEDAAEEQEEKGHDVDVAEAAALRLARKLQNAGAGGCCVPSPARRE